MDDGLTATRGTALSDSDVSAALDVTEGVFQGGPQDRARDGEAAVQNAVAAAYAAREPLLIHGGNTKSAMLRPVQAARVVCLADNVGVTLYAPKELVFSARSGTPVAEIEAVLSQAGQHLIAEPPDYARLLGAEPGARQTLGGIVSTNLSGPRRVAWGAVRDHVLGVRAVNGTGEIIRSGGRVLKNVTGLDLCKLLTGAHGTLGVLTEITLKVLPAPEDSASVIVRGLAPEAAVGVLSDALGSPFGVSGAAHLPARAAAILGEVGPLTLVRIEESAASVVYRSEKLRAGLTARGVTEIWPRAKSEPAWRAIRDADLLPNESGDAIWRISVRPSQGPAVLNAVETAGGNGYLDWGGGLAIVAGPATEAMHATVSQAVKAVGGVWTLLRAPAPWRAVVPVVPPEAPALSAITRRVKAALDPAGILNPGRIYAGV